MKCWCSASFAGIRTLRLAAVAVGLCGWAAVASAQGLLEQGKDHYLNQEFSEAADAFRMLVEREPANPRAHVELAKALLYEELQRRRFLDTSAFGGDEEFYAGGKPDPDSEANARILAAVEAGRALCEERIGADKDDIEALHSLAQILALRGNYQFMLSKAYFKALSSGRRARAASLRVSKLDPAFVDAQLVAGVDHYILGSLPWAARMLISLSGYRGSKKRGMALIERVASEGGESRDDARVLLALLYSRERRYKRAAEAFESIARDFPRAYTYQLEAAAMHKAAGNPGRALEILRDAERKRASGQDRFDRMPERVAAALGRAIERLDESLAGREG